jgi:hypothetical protein
MKTKILRNENRSANPVRGPADAAAGRGKASPARCHVAGECEPPPAVGSRAAAAPRNSGEVEGLMGAGHGEGQSHGRSKPSEAAA